MKLILRQVHHCMKLRVAGSFANMVGRTNIIVGAGIMEDIKSKQTII